MLHCSRERALRENNALPCEQLHGKEAHMHGKDLDGNGTFAVRLAYGGTAMIVCTATLVFPVVGVFWTVLMPLKL
jgi:hypothetical protein